MQIKEEKSIAVVGPTASGKSDIAIRLAKTFSGEIISVDSRQIYRGMDIGTGKEPGTIVPHPQHPPITRNPYISDDILHYMIDIVHPRTPYSLGKFLPKAQRVRDDIWHRGKLPIICGGTLFWAQALIENTTLSHIPPNTTLRAELHNYTTTQLYEKLCKSNPVQTQTIDPHNRHRLIRAIEIAHSGTPIHEDCTQIFPKDDPHTLILAISHPRDALYARIKKRLDARLEAGMINEAHRLHVEEKVSWKRMEQFGLEYRWCTRYIRKQISYDVFYDKLLLDIRHYAKRQITWMRRWEKQNPNIHHITSADEAIKIAYDFLHSKNR